MRLLGVGRQLKVESHEAGAQLALHEMRDTARMNCCMIANNCNARVRATL
jgi:hypothetical protein